MAICNFFKCLNIVTACLYFINIFISFSESLAHPNVLLIIVDDLRPVIGSYGDPFAITPYIDNLARSGVIFTRAYAQQALCGPSRTSFLTSRRPDTTRLIDVHSYWRSHAGNFTSLPQYFKENGYHTVSAGKVFHPGIVSNHSDDQPYSWSEVPFHPSTQAHKQDPVCLSADGNFHTNIYCPVNVLDQPEKTLPDIQTTDYSLKWLRKWKWKISHLKKKERHYLRIKHNKIYQKHPFFFAVGLHKPHIPLKFPVEFLELYKLKDVPLAPNRKLPDGLPAVAYNPWNDLRRREDISSLNISFPFDPIPDHYARYIRQGYYAATSYTDSLIGALVSKTKKLFPNTIIALIGDHGWSLGEHQEWSKFSNYEVSTRVPFIISLPDANAKKGFKPVSSGNFKHFQKEHIGGFEKETKPRTPSFKYDGIVELVDLFPTLVDLAGLKKIPKCPTFPSNRFQTCTEGMSLACLINHLINPSRDKYSTTCLSKKAAISQYPRPGPYPTMDPDSDQPRLRDTSIMGYSMRTSRFRYTAWLRFDPTTFNVSWEQIYGEELYFHPTDEDENHNIISNVINVSKYREYLKEGLRDPISLITDLPP